MVDAGGGLQRRHLDCLLHDLYAIVRPLVSSRQLRTNALGAATAAIFLTCAVHHGAHVVHMLMPYAGVDLEQGMAMRKAWGPPAGASGTSSAPSSRPTTGPCEEASAASSASPQLFKDQVEREQRALELNDTVLQGMVVARMALDLGERKRGMAALDTSIAAASQMITELIGDDRGHLGNRPLRSSPALVEGQPDAAVPGEDT